MRRSYEVMEFDPWLASLQDGRSEAERELLRRAYDLANQAHANQKRASGEPYIQHCLAAAQMLADLRLDTNTLAAALLPLLRVLELLLRGPVLLKPGDLLEAEARGIGAGGVGGLIVDGHSDIISRF